MGGGLARAALAPPELCSNSMKIVIAIKQVSARDSQLRIAPSGKWIDSADLAYEINEPDAYALEEGLQLKEKHGGEVVVLTAGPARAAQTLREALAKGADRAIHIEIDDERAGELDPLASARLLGDAIKAESPDLTLTGLQSDDLGYGQTGVILAELLGLPHATIVMQVEKQDGAIRVKRELEDGWFQWVELPLPALLTIQSGISKLRYATLMGIKKAKTKELKTLSAAELSVCRESSLRYRLTASSGPSAPSVRRSSAARRAKRPIALVEKLKFEARVL